MNYHTLQIFLSDHLYTAPCGHNQTSSTSYTKTIAENYQDRTTHGRSNMKNEAQPEQDHIQYPFTRAPYKAQNYNLSGTTQLHEN